MKLLARTHPEYVRFHEKYISNREKLLVQHKLYRKRNPEKARDYYQRNRERLAEYKGRWYQENKDRVLARTREWYAKNRDRQVARKREASRKKQISYPSLRCRRCGADFNAPIRHGPRPQFCSEGCKATYRHEYSRNWYQNNRECLALQDKRRYERNREDRKLSVKIYQQKNPEAVRLYKKRWRNRNCEYHNEWRRNWRKLHPEKARTQAKIEKQRYRERIRVYAKAYRKKNRVILRSQFREWCQRDPERMRNHNRKRRALKASARGSHTPQQWLEKVAYYGWHCFYCSLILNKSTLTQDHAIPLSKGGTNFTANLLPCCGFCNSAKKDRTVFEFLAKRKTEVVTR